MIKGVDYIGVGVGGVIINDSNKILLLLRKNDPEAGCWSIPGGSVEFGEKVEDALVREIYEELNIKVKIEKLLRVTNHIINDKKIHWVSPAYLVKIISKNPVNRNP